MRLRQARDRERLTRFRVVAPGEVDHEIDLGQLAPLPPPDWPAASLAACGSIYDRWVVPAAGGRLPDAAFCDVPRWVFLEYAVRFRGVLLGGANDPGLNSLPPVVLSRNLSGWNAPRHFAFANSADAVFRAVLDRERLRELDCRGQERHGVAVRGAGASARWGFYFGIDYRALPHAPCGRAPSTCTTGPTSRRSARQPPT